MRILIIIALVVLSPFAHADKKKPHRTMVVYDSADRGDAKEGKEKCTSGVATGIGFAAAANKCAGCTKVDVTERGDNLQAFEKTIEQIYQACDEGASPFDDIRFYDHGCEGYQTVGNYFWGKETVTSPRGAKLMEKLGKCFRQGASLSLYGCTVGGGEQGKAFIQTLANTVPNIGLVQSSSVCSTWGSDGNVGIKFDRTATPEKKIGALLGEDRTYAHARVGGAAPATHW